MLSLRTVTLIQVDTTANRARAEHAMLHAMRGIDFAASKLLTADELPHVKNYEDYNRFVVTELHQHFDTEHCLLIQWDGYPVNPGMWFPEYLQYDYIGAPWPDNTQGNGGFSLRSHKLCRATAEIKVQKYAPEDVVICRTYRKHLQAQGIRFAPIWLADMFSFERSPGRDYYHGQFGFHGSHSKAVMPAQLL